VHRIAFLLVAESQVSSRESGAPCPRGTPEVNPSTLAWIAPQGVELQPGSARILGLHSQPAWGRAIKDGNNALPLLILHILAGSIGLLTGTVAMAVRKGGKVHRASGNVFTVAMLTLATSAFFLAILKSQEDNIVGSIGTFYLIGTAWLAGRRGERTRLVDWSALFIGLAGGVAAIALGVHTLHNPGGVDKTTAPAGMSFFLGAILLLATAGEIRMLSRDGISGGQRITRHLWRMCYGLFIATGSFFLGQQVFPAFLRGSIFLTLPALLPLPLIIYWLLRVRFSKAYK
jgi:uncharacterized membrane protein